MVNSRLTHGTLLLAAIALVVPSFAAAPAPAGARAAAVAASPPASLSASLAQAPKVFPPIPDDPIERPEFRNTPHVLTKSITAATAMMIREQPNGTMIGMTSDIIATVPAETRNGKVSTATFVAKQAEVGEEMKTSFDEAVRAVKLRYPRWEPGRIEFSFGEKYTAHDGGSAGTCFATMLLSELEGFEIDPKCAVTGDITVDWKVRKIGGVGAKLRGAAADHCLYAGIPEENSAQLADMALMYGDASLRDIQVFSMATLQDAVALLRKDRAPQLTEAMKVFTELQPRMKNRAALASPDVQKTLEQILVYAPNHASAKWLLEIGQGKAPKKLSTSYALNEILLALHPYRAIIIKGSPITRTTVPASMYQAARKQLEQIGPLTPPELQNLMRDANAIVSTAESIATKQAQPAVMTERAKSFMSHLEAMEADRDIMEKLMREGL